MSSLIWLPVGPEWLYPTTPTGIQGEYGFPHMAPAASWMPHHLSAPMQTSRAEHGGFTRPPQDVASNRVNGYALRHGFSVKGVAQDRRSAHPQPPRHAESRSAV